MFFSIKKAVGTEPLLSEAAQKLPSKPGVARAAEKVGRGLLSHGGTGKIPSVPLKRLFRPVAWAKPSNPERWLNKVIDSALKELPAKVLGEMSNFPQVDHQLADQHGTTVFNLMSDYEHLAATHATYHLAHSVNVAMNKDWGPAARQMANEKISGMAQTLILRKLEQLLDPGQLNALTDSLGKHSHVTAPDAVSQKESFALTQLTDSLIGHVLTESQLANDFNQFYESVIDDFKVSDNPYGREANEYADDPNPYYQMLDELGHIQYSYNGPPSDESAAGMNRILGHLSPAELKQAHLNLFAALESGLTGFYEAFDKYVKSDPSEFAQSTAKVKELVTALSTSSASEVSPEAQQWVETQKEKFKLTINQALDGLNSKTRGALLATIVAPHLQKLGDLYTSQARNLPAIQSASNNLDMQRQQNSSGMRSEVGFGEKKWIIQSALKGLKNTIGQYGFADVRQAYADNRSGYATKDTGMQRHTAKVAGSTMLKGVAPMHRGFVLSALSDYGQEVTSFLKRRGVKVQTAEVGKGLSDRPQRSFEQVYSDYSQPRAVKPTIFTRKQNAERLTSLPATANMVSYEAQNLGLPHFDGQKNEVVMSRLFSSGGEYFAAHELGHALDFSLGKKEQQFFSPTEPSMVDEYKQNIRNQDGITVYGQSHLLETFAESAAAFLNQHGPGSSHESWTGQNDLFSRENLKQRQPVMEAFMDEITGNPERLGRAVFAARQKATM